MKNYVLTLALCLAAAAASAQGVSTIPPGSSGGATYDGGAVTNPFLAPSGCANPGYSFTGVTTTGVCYAGGQLQGQNLPVGNSMSYWNLRTTEAQFTHNDGGGLVSRLYMTDSGWQLQADNVVSMAGTSATIQAGIPITGADGAVGAPAFAFTSDADGTGTGLYRPAANSIGFSTNGVLGLTIAPTAITATVPFLAANGAVGAPSYSFTSAPTTTGIYTSGDGDIIIKSNTAGGKAVHLGVLDNVQIFGSATLFLNNDAATLGIGGSARSILRSDAANTLALRNGGTAGVPVPQTFNVYNFCDGAACATGYERLALFVDVNGFHLSTQTAGTGSAKNLVLFPASGDTKSRGHLSAYTADTYDLGSAASWRNEYLTRSIQGSKSKALTDNTATAFVRVAIPQTIATNYKGGQVIYEIYCDDDTNQASQSGTVKFACHNLAGTEACGFGTPDGVTLGDGTASLAAPVFDANSAVADTIDLRVQSDCTGITPNTHTIEYRLDMPTTATITPQ